MQDRSGRPDPNVRYDVGGWISGPCLSVPLPDPPDDPIAAILRVAGDRWEITTPLGLYAAERRDGTSVRYLVARDPVELVRKILAADE